MDNIEEAQAQVQAARIALNDVRGSEHTTFDVLYAQQVPANARRLSLLSAVAL